MLLILIVFVLIIFVCIFGYLTYRDNATKRQKEKRRDIFNDRV